LLSVAVSAYKNDKKRQTKTTIFFPRKEKKESKRKKKKDMQVIQQCSGGCQGFLEKYYPKRSGGVEIFSKTCRA
jgi:hypothetical protein